MKHLTIVMLTAIVLTGCDKARIEGEVVDMFGNPIAGANVSVKGTQYASTTDDDGQYSLEYVPGDFSVVVAKEGYTDSTSTFKLATKEVVPVAPVLLYLAPKDKGFYFIRGSDAGGSLAAINPAKIHYEETGDPFSSRQPAQRIWSVDGNNSTPLEIPLSHDSLTFLDNDGVEQVLVSSPYAIEGLYDLVTKTSVKDQLGYFTGTFRRQIKTVPFKLTSLPNGMYLWKCKLEEGTYSFVSLNDRSENPIAGPVYFISVCAAGDCDESITVGAITPTTPPQSTSEPDKEAPAMEVVNTSFEKDEQGYRIATKKNFQFSPGWSANEPLEQVDFGWSDGWFFSCPSKSSTKGLEVVPSVDLGIRDLSDVSGLPSLPPHSDRQPVGGGNITKVAHKAEEGHVYYCRTRSVPGHNVLVKVLSVGPKERLKCQWRLVKA